MPRARSSKASSDAKAATEKRLKEANEELQWQEFRQLHLRVEALKRTVEERERRRWWHSIPGLGATPCPPERRPGDHLQSLGGAYAVGR